jgi:hypothetical protein
VPTPLGTAEVGTAGLGVRDDAGDMLVIAVVVRLGKPEAGEIRPAVRAKAERPAITARPRIERFIWAHLSSEAG